MTHAAMYVHTCVGVMHMHIQVIVSASVQGSLRLVELSEELAYNRVVISVVSFREHWQLLSND